MTSSVALASPYHDPEARLLADTKHYSKTLMRLYDNHVAVSVSDTTATNATKALFASDIRVQMREHAEQLSIGTNYLTALKKSLTFQTEAIHLLDFDRALHWVRLFPEELATITNKLTQEKGLTIFIRSQRAFQTHPTVQRLTESTVNSIASEIAGREVDIMSGSFGMDRSTAMLILEKSCRQDYGFYAEVLQIALRAKVPLHALEVEGLEWETPDQYRHEIERNGYLKWLTEFESLDEWERRVKIIDDSKNVLL